MRISFTMFPQRVLPCCALLALACLLVACGEDDQAGQGDGRRLKIVATTTQAADLAANVGGDHVDVVGLLAPNADPHGYELRPPSATTPTATASRSSAP
jgi:ABC-type Zn uptake system ZnuABC Zn-binding protein ZnuA